MKKLLIGFLLLSSFAMEAAFVADVLDATGNAVVDVGRAATFNGPRATERRQVWRENRQERRDQRAARVENIQDDATIHQKDYQDFEADGW